MPMKILIDGCVFTQNNQTEAIQFWKHLIPHLNAELQGHTIYFLNRSWTPAFPEIDWLKNLFAPGVDFNNFAIETCRLSALCQELEIDLFVSTYNTSAGTQVKSLLVLGVGEKIRPTSLQGDEDGVWLANQRSIKMARGYLIIYKSEEIENIENLGVLDKNCIWLAEPDPTSDFTKLYDNLKPVAAQFVRALHELLDYEPPAEVIAQLRAEDEAVKTEALRIKLAAEEAVKGQGIYPEYKPEKPRKFAGLSMNLLRFYTAVKRLNKYPEYAGRIYRLVKQKISYRQ
jgi:hypothetical protein